MQGVPGTQRFPYVFIITYGRSGSTLLQGVLNTIPGYCIRGENNGVLRQFRGSYEQLASSHKRFSNIGQTSADPWYGIDQFDEKAYLRGVRRLFINQVLQPPEGTRCMGFKEIRYAQGMVGNLAEHLKFMRRLFPKCAFVFNSRNLEDVLKSGWWKDHDNPAAFLGAFEESMEKAYKCHQAHSFWVRYDDYVRSPEALEPLFDFLGETFDLPAITETLAVKHSG